MGAKARIRHWTLPLVMVLGLTGTTGPHRDRDGDLWRLRIETVSNRADLISGGDALIEVTVPPGIPVERVVVRANGREITASLTADAPARRLRGLVHGLHEGRNELTAEVRVRRAYGFWHRDHHEKARLVVTNHPLGGPVLSGAQIPPWVCATPTAQPGDATTPHTNASGLSGAATDDRCTIAREYRYWYRPTTAPATCAGISPANPCFKPYDRANPPADVATTTTDQGVTTPYVVRVERGTINRGIYDLAALVDPAAPGDGRPVWNGKVLYGFGASTGSPRRQFAPQTSWANDEALRRGFMTAASSLTDQLLNSNLIVAAETVMMLEEHVIERYGPIRYVMGSGCSGGSITQNVIASTYPGLLDGLQINCTYPDAVTTALEVGDCVLLGNAFDTPAFAALTAGLTPEQVNAKKAAFAGHQDQRGCPAWKAAFGHAALPGFIADRPPAPDPWTPPSGPRADVPNNCLLPMAMVYDPATNPTGIRCGAYQHIASIVGLAEDPRFPGRANLTGDNVGVEYGRGALLAGTVTPEEFVTINELVGGSDPDGRPTATRSTADIAGLRTVYRSGLVADGRSLAQVPIIDLRGNDDAGIHHDWRSFALRARLDQATGGHANHALWRFGPTLIPPPAANLTRQSFTVLDAWLGAIEADRSHAPIERKIAAHKPAEAADFCYLSTDTTYSTRVTDQALCDADPVLRYHASPRQVAGGPLAENVLKCRLRPLDTKDYGTVAFSAGQWERLQKVFPTGVCDWAGRGVAQEPARPWTTFAGGPGGRPLPPAPASR